MHQFVIKLTRKMHYSKLTAVLVHANPSKSNVQMQRELLIRKERKKTVRSLTLKKCKSSNQMLWNKPRLRDKKYSMLFMPNNPVKF